MEVPWWAKVVVEPNPTELECIDKRRRYSSLGIETTLDDIYRYTLTYNILLIYIGVHWDYSFAPSFILIAYMIFWLKSKTDPLSFNFYHFNQLSFVISIF